MKLALPQGALILAGALLMAGCASTPERLRSYDYAKREFTIDVGYQLVLKRLVDQYANCVRGPLLPLGSVINDVQNYPDLRSASIVRGAQGFGRDIFQVYDIKETAPGQTRVEMWFHTMGDSHAANAKRAAFGDAGC